MNDCRRTRAQTGLQKRNNWSQDSFRHLLQVYLAIVGSNYLGQALAHDFRKPLRDMAAQVETSPYHFRKPFWLKL